MEDIIFWSFGVIVVFNFYLHYKVQKLLRTKHPEVWFALGQPDQFTPTNDVVSKQSVIKEYLKNKQYLSTNDQEFIRLCDFLRKFNQISVFILIIFFTSMIYFIFIKST